MTQVQIVHHMMREKGANTGESIRLEFFGTGQAHPVRVSAFTRGHVPAGRKRTTSRDPFTYTVVLRTGDASFITRLHTTQAGLAHDMLMTSEFNRLLRVLQANGWVQAGDIQVSEDNQGWGNIFTEKTATLHPAGDQVDTTPQFPPDLLVELEREKDEVYRVLLDAERKLVTGWRRIAVTHEATWRPESGAYMHESLTVLGFPIDGGEVETFGDYNGRIGTARPQDGGIVYRDQVYELILRAPTPTRAPTPGTAFVFADARERLLARLEGYGFARNDPQVSDREMPGAQAFSLGYSLARVE